MPKGSERFGAKAISSFSRKISESIFNLTCLYAVIIFAILLISSSVTFSIFHERVNRRFNGSPAPIMQLFADDRIITVTPTVDNVSDDLFAALLIVNGLLFIVSVSLSYLLALLTLQPIQEAYDKQRRFLSDASHELRTPLSILYANLENQLAEKHLTADQRDNAESNLDEAKRMGKIINELLMLSRLEEHSNKFEIAEFDLAALLKEITGRLISVAVSRQVSLDSSALPAEALIISSVKELLDQALTNFIRNAIDYNKPGGSVSLSATKLENVVTIIITDTGLGIPREEIGKVFDRFHRVDKSRSRNTGGSGLGLAIAKESLDKLGAKISLDSRPGNGTTVTVTMPATFNHTIKL